MPFFGDFSESTDPAGALTADPLQYIKDCLPAPAGACPLHVKGAWTALFKFFIGQPAEPVLAIASASYFNQYTEHCLQSSH